jgi:hypothetical protein
MTDGAGDQVSASSHVSGLIVDETGLEMTGWAVNKSPDLQIWRKGTLIYVHRVHPSQDGVYHLELPHSGRTSSLLPGDSISVGSRWRRHRLVVADLGARLAAGSKQVQIHGPSGGRVSVVVTHASRRRTMQIALGSTGRFILKMGAAMSVGDSVSLALPTSTGDTLTATSRIRGVVVHLGSSTVSGQTVSGGAVNVKVFGAHGAIGGAGALADPTTGVFSTVLRDKTRHSLNLASGMRLLIEDPMGGIEETVPRLAIERTTSIGRVRVAAEAPSILLYLVNRRGQRQRERLTLGASGASTVTLRNAASLHSVVVSTEATNGISFERTLRVQPRPACHRQSTTRTCSSATHGKHAH